MAQSHAPQTWQRGFSEPHLTTPTPAWADAANYQTEGGERAHYAVPEGGEKPTSRVPNAFGLSSLRSWPSLYNGTEEEMQEMPSEVDVLICGGKCFLARRHSVSLHRIASHRDISSPIMAW